jgi:hypothetical protein
MQVSPKSAGWPLLSAALSIACCAAVRAETVSIASYDIGWYASSGHHVADNPNTLTGILSDTYRSFYIWKIPKLAGTITSARIDFKLEYSLGANGSSDQYGRLYDLKVGKRRLPYIQTDDGDGLGTKIYADIGEGQTFGKLTVPPEIFDDTWIKAKLNASAVAALNASSGKYFGVGIVNVTPDLSDGMYFLVSSGSRPSEQILVLHVEPAP